MNVHAEKEKTVENSYRLVLTCNWKKNITWKGWNWTIPLNSWNHHYTIIKGDIENPPKEERMYNIYIYSRSYILKIHVTCLLLVNPGSTKNASQNGKITKTLIASRWVKQILDFFINLNSLALFMILLLWRAWLDKVVKVSFFGTCVIRGSQCLVQRHRKMPNSHRHSSIWHMEPNLLVN